MYRRIRDLREDSDLLQRDLAEYLQCSQVCYSHYEMGKRDIPTDVLIKLADFYHILKSLFRRICSSHPGDGEQRRQSLAALTACDWGLDCFQPQRMAACLTCRPDVVCPNRLGGMMQPAKAAHGAFFARRKLTASGSSRAPCAFPNLRCDPRCWYSLFNAS